jgi:pilus assembly protein CpaF
VRSSRRVQSISELVGMEADTPQLQEIFRFVPRGRQNRRITGDFVATGIVPQVIQQMRAEEIDIPMSLFQPTQVERESQWQ